MHLSQAIAFCYALLNILVALMCVMMDRALLYNECGV